MNWVYSVYGLTIGSESYLPGLLCSSETSQPETLRVDIGFEPPGWVSAGRRLPSTTCYQRPIQANGDPALNLVSYGDGELYELSYSDGTTFVIDRNATRTWGTYSSPLVLEDLSVYFRGPILGFILRRRGTVALHASAVSIDGRAVVFCGCSASGKSTTAAALALKGFPVISDDIVPLKDELGEFEVEPGCPQVCLWPDAVKQLLGAADVLPKLTPTWEKCFLPLDGYRARFGREKQPLRIIYIFGSPERTDAPRIEPLPPSKALLQLTANTYMQRLLDRTQRAEEFEVLSRLVTKVPVRQLVPHSDAARIENMCNLIIEDGF